MFDVTAHCTDICDAAVAVDFIQFNHAFNIIEQQYLFNGHLPEQPK